jgi:hypothetical protein
LYPQVKQCVQGGGAWDRNKNICVAKAAPVLPSYLPSSKQLLCYAMPGAFWDSSKKMCVTLGGSFFSEDDLVTAAGTGNCPPGQVNTPEAGCQAIPGGDIIDLDCPEGQTMDKSGKCVSPGMSTNTKLLIGGAVVLGAVLLLK